jgi:hypothetical protein
MFLFLFLHRLSESSYIRRVECTTAKYGLLFNVILGLDAYICEMFGTATARRYIAAVVAN